MSEIEKEKILSRFLKCQPEELIGSEKKLFEAIMKIANERDYYKHERDYYKNKYKELKEYYKTMRDCDEEFEL